MIEPIILIGAAIAVNYLGCWLMTLGADSDDP